MDEKLMPRTRERHSQMGLLERMEARPRKDGWTYRYHPIGGKPINLGHEKVEAIRKVLDLIGTPSDPLGTLSWVWGKYTDETKPAARWARLAQGTRNDYALAWKQIDKVFGAMLASHIDASMIARYVHVERQDSPRRANIEKALMSNLFGHAILLGVAKANPTTDVQPHVSEPRTEAPEAETLTAFLAWLEKQTPQRRIIGMAAEYASLAGSRKIEFLNLTWRQVDTEAGVIRLVRAKQRGKLREQVIDLVAVNDKLQSLLVRLQALHRQRGQACAYVFPTRDDQAYTARGFKTLWQRCVLAAIEEKIIDPAARFTFHDLRAYYATTHKQMHGDLPDLHKNKETTARVYDRSKEVKRRSL